VGVGWEAVQRRERKGLSAYQMLQEIVKTSQEILAHIMHSSDEQWTRLCLTGEFGVDLNNTIQSNVAAANT
jgi:hypothetical protein